MGTLLRVDTNSRFYVNFHYGQFNPFLSNIPFIYPLKTSENKRFSDVFRGYKKGTLETNGLMFFIVGKAFVINTFQCCCGLQIVYWISTFRKSISAVSQMNFWNISQGLHSAFNPKLANVCPQSLYCREFWRPVQKISWCTTKNYEETQDTGMASGQYSFSI